MKLLLALMCSATAFPAMLGKRVWPIAPTPEELIPTREGDWPKWYHELKNVTTEYIQADPQWWGKAFPFTILLSLILGIIF